MHSQKVTLAGVGNLSPIKAGGPDNSRKKKEQAEIRDIMNERLAQKITHINLNSRANKFNGQKLFNSHNTNQDSKVPLVLNRDQIQYNKKQCPQTNFIPLTAPIVKEIHANLTSQSPNHDRIQDKYQSQLNPKNHDQKLNQQQRKSDSFHSFSLQPSPAKGSKYFQKNPVLIDSSPQARKKEVESKQATLEQTNEELLFTFLQGGRLTPIERITVSETLQKRGYFTKNQLDNTIQSLSPILKQQSISPFQERKKIITTSEIPSSSIRSQLNTQSKVQSPYQTIYPETTTIEKKDDQHSKSVQNHDKRSNSSHSQHSVVILNPPGYEANKKIIENYKKQIDTPLQSQEQGQQNAMKTHINHHSDSKTQAIQLKKIYSNQNFNQDSLQSTTLQYTDAQKLPKQQYQIQGLKLSSSGKIKTNDQSIKKEFISGIYSQNNLQLTLNQSRNQNYLNRESKTQMKEVQTKSIKKFKQFPSSTIYIQETQQESGVKNPNFRLKNQNINSPSLFPQVFENDQKSQFKSTLQSIQDGSSEDELYYNYRPATSGNVQIQANTVTAQLQEKLNHLLCQNQQLQKMSYGGILMNQANDSGYIHEETYNIMPIEELMSTQQLLMHQAMAIDRTQNATADYMASLNSRKGSLNHQRNAHIANQASGFQLRNNFYQPPNSTHTLPTNSSQTLNKRISSNLTSHSLVQKQSNQRAISSDKPSIEPSIKFDVGMLPDDKESIYRLYEMMVKNQQILNRHAVSVGSEKSAELLLDEKNSVLLKGKVKVAHDSSLGFTYQLDNGSNEFQQQAILFNDTLPLKRPKITQTVLNGKLKSGQYLAEFLKQKKEKSRVSLEETNIYMQSQQAMQENNLMMAGGKKFYKVSKLLPDQHPNQQITLMTGGDNMWWRQWGSPKQQRIHLKNNHLMQHSQLSQVNFGSSTSLNRNEGSTPKTSKMLIVNQVKSPSQQSQMGAYQTFAEGYQDNRMQNYLPSKFKSNQVPSAAVPAVCPFPNPCSKRNSKNDSKIFTSTGQGVTKENGVVLRKRDNNNNIKPNQGGFPLDDSWDKEFNYRTQQNEKIAGFQHHEDEKDSYIEVYENSIDEMDIDQQQKTFEFKGEIDILDSRPKKSIAKEMSGNNQGISSSKPIILA